MLVRSVAVVLSLVPFAGCQSGAASDKRPSKAAPIEARDATKTIVARVQPGHPCRATVEGFELLVGGRPLLAQHGTDRWTGEDAENGTTLRKNDQIVARIHANQLFDGEGLPVLRVLETGDVIDKANAVIRKASVANGAVTIGELTVTGTINVALAAMLTAREAVPELRALVACHYLLEKSS